jgi:hypothetical protein
VSDTDVRQGGKCQNFAPNELGGRFDLRQEPRDVEAAVLGRVRPEASRSLLELPLAADAVPTPGLVPGDRDVDKPLEEVALVGRCGAPRVLERLVRSEELAPANQLEPARELVRDRP